MLQVRRGGGPRRSSVLRGCAEPLPDQQRSAVRRKEPLPASTERHPSKLLGGADGAGCGLPRNPPALSWHRPYGGDRRTHLRRKPTKAGPAEHGCHSSAMPRTCGDHGWDGSSRQLGPTLSAAATQNGAASSGGHPVTEAVVLGPLTDVGLKGALHWIFLLGVETGSPQPVPAPAHIERSPDAAARAAKFGRPTTLRPNPMAGQPQGGRSMTSTFSFVGDGLAHSQIHGATVRPLPPPTGDLVRAAREPSQPRGHPGPAV